MVGRTRQRWNQALLAALLWLAPSGAWASGEHRTPDLRQVDPAPQQQAVRLRIRDGERSVLDGPYAEAKEMIGGFFLLNCDTREEALALAAECPAAQWATVEVRTLAPCYDESAARPAQVARVAT